MNPIYLLLIIVFISIGAGVMLVGLMLDRKNDNEDESDSQRPRTVDFVASTFRRIGEQVSDDQQKEASTRSRLNYAGYRSPEALDVFQGSRIAVGVLLAVTFALIALWTQEGELTASLVGAVAGGGLGYLLPERILDWRVSVRRRQIRRHLPSALDLLILSVEAGQSLDQACAETGRQLQRVARELSEEFLLLNIEMKAGRSREEALRGLGSRNGEVELRRLSAVLLDADRFGTNLAPTLRTQARYLRSRMRQQAQEKARKIGVKLVFPLVLLIFPSMLLVTLGPPVTKMMDVLSRNTLF